VVIVVEEAAKVGVEVSYLSDGMALCCCDVVVSCLDEDLDGAYRPL